MAETFHHNWRGQRCTFEATLQDGQLVIDKNGIVRPGEIKISGVVADQKFIGRRGPEMIPDYQITVRGRSGSIAKISLLDNNFQLKG